MALNEVRWHPDAAVDAEEARDWYVVRSPLAARGFLLALEAAISAVVEAPERWPFGKHHCRRYIFQQGYPYSLVYRVSPHVEIVAVAHHKRHPDYWANR